MSNFSPFDFLANKNHKEAKKILLSYKYEMTAGKIHDGFCLAVSHHFNILVITDSENTTLSLVQVRFLRLPARSLAYVLCSRLAGLERVASARIRERVEHLYNILPDSVILFSFSTQNGGFKMNCNIHRQYVYNSMKI